MRAPARRQRGYIAIALAILITILLSVIGMAIDLGHTYVRVTELHAAADAAALSAARKLDGTAAGIDSAIAKASAAMSEARYSFFLTMPWSDNAIRFSSSPDTAAGAWLSAGAARAAPAGILYARIDTAELTSDNVPGTVALAFGKIYSDDAQLSMHAVAVAGRKSMEAVPLGICALSNAPTAARPPAGTELLEFGFRRGVGYNLLSLNPQGASAASFVLNAIDETSAAHHPANMDPSVVGPLLCTGALPRRNLTGGTGKVYVNQPFPAALANALNSRFDDYSANYCNEVSGPPDRNTVQYTNAVVSAWMNAISSQTAANTSAAPLLTIADLANPGTVAAGSYGPLWLYTRAAKYAAAPPYASFGKTDWASLYPTGGTPPAPGLSYPGTGTPYSTFLAAKTPTHYGLVGRRLIQVALLECPVAGSTGVAANVLGIGKFFLTAKADLNGIYAEFAGVAKDETLTNSVELIL